MTTLKTKKLIRRKKSIHYFSIPIDGESKKEILNNSKVFVLYACGDSSESASNDIRKHLLDRGWIERMPPCLINKGSHVNFSGMKYRSKLTYKNYSRKENDKVDSIDLLIPKFIWTRVHSDINWKTLKDFQIICKFKNTKNIIGKKNALINTLNLRGSEKKDLFFPKSFDLSIEENRHKFIFLFLLYSSFNILKMRKIWKPNKIITKMSISILNSYLEHGLIIPKLFNPVLIHILLQFTYIKNNTSFDVIPLKKPFFNYKNCNSDINPFKTQETDLFNKKYLYDNNFYICSRKGIELYKNLEDDSYDEKYDSVIDELLSAVVETDSSFAVGEKNAWIVKPQCDNQGNGIFCENRLDLILDFMTKSDNYQKYVIQRYCERPLLINNIKFDIRQWVIVKKWNPPVAYIFNKFYIRFSSKEYCIDDIRNIKSHLTNQAINNPPDKDGYGKSESTNYHEWTSLNTWTSDELYRYLKTKDLYDKWMEKTLPIIKQAIYQTCQAGSSEIIERENTFELLGFDFLVDEDLSPWLLEVNLSPTLIKKTKSHSYLVSLLNRDMVELIIDNMDNIPKQVGNFELIEPN